MVRFIVAGTGTNVPYEPHRCQLLKIKLGGLCYSVSGSKLAAGLMGKFSRTLCALLFEIRVFQMRFRL